MSHISSYDRGKENDVANISMVSNVKPGLGASDFSSCIMESI